MKLRDLAAWVDPLRWDIERDLRDLEDLDELD